MIACSAFMGCAMFFFGPRLHLGIRNLLMISIVFVGGCLAVMASSGYEKLRPNSNQNPAGQLTEGKLTIHLEAAMGEWHPTIESPALPSAAFREEGGPLSAPGPLLRVVEGTEIDAIVFNRLDQALTLHGLHRRPGNPKTF
jgi:FtsP/CotA-like multicopper oxidase with cupredoxin domain